MPHHNYFNVFFTTYGMYSGKNEDEAVAAYASDVNAQSS